MFAFLFSGFKFKWKGLEPWRDQNPDGNIAALYHKEANLVLPSEGPSFEFLFISPLHQYNFLTFCGFFGVSYRQLSVSEEYKKSIESIKANHTKLIFII